MLLESQWLPLGLEGAESPRRGVWAAVVEQQKASGVSLSDWAASTGFSLLLLRCQQLLWEAGNQLSTVYFSLFLVSRCTSRFTPSASRPAVGTGCCSPPSCPLAPLGAFPPAHQSPCEFGPVTDIGCLYVLMYKCCYNSQNPCLLMGHLGSRTGLV